MAAVLLRVFLLALGMGVVEISLGSALTQSSVVEWALVLVVGVPLIVAGSAGFIVPLFEGRSREGSKDA